MAKTIQQILEEERKKSPLSTISDKTINHTLASQAKAQDPIWLEKTRTNNAKRKGCKEWSDYMSSILTEKYKDPVARKKIAESNRKKAQDISIRKKLSDKATERYKDPLQRQLAREQGLKRKKDPKWKIDTENRTKASILVTSKPIMCRHGAFSSKMNAARYYQVDNANIGYWLKTKPTEFYILTKEEYEKIKHIPIQPFSELLPHPSRKKNKIIKK